MLAIALARIWRAVCPINANLTIRRFSGGFILRIKLVC
jgi:hypothetical protein